MEAAKALLKPHLDSTYIDSLQVGQDHQIGQDHAWSDQSSLDSMHANLQEALLHRANPGKVQQLADHSTGEWFKIGERKGWSDDDIGQQAMQTKAQLFGAVIKANLQDGDLLPALATLVQAKGQVAPAQWQPMQQTVQTHVDSILPPASGGDDTLYGGGPVDTIMPSNGGDQVDDGGDGDGVGGPQNIGLTDRYGNPADIVPPTKNDARPKPVLKNSRGQTSPGRDYALKWFGNHSDWVKGPVGSGITDVEARSEPDPFVTEFWDYLGAKFNKSRDESILGPLIGGATLPANAIYSLNPEQARRLADALSKLKYGNQLAQNPNLLNSISEYAAHPPEFQKKEANELIERALRDAGIKFLTEEEWQKSGWAHPALQFEPFMTPERAEARLQNLKKLAAYDYLIRQRPDGVFSGTAGFFAGLAGDPVNYIPGALPFKEIYAGARYGVPALFRTVRGAAVADTVEAGVASTVNSAPKMAPAAEGVGPKSGVSAGTPLGGEAPNAPMQAPKPGQPGPSAPGTAPSGATPPSTPLLTPPSQLRPLPGLNNPAAAWRQVITDATHQDEFTKQMAPFQSLGLIKTEADVAKFASAYRPNTILLPMPPSSKVPPGDMVWRADSASMKIGADGKRTFARTQTNFRNQGEMDAADRTVALANKIEQTYPGEVVCVHCTAVPLKGKFIENESDIVTRQYLIEEKDSGRHLWPQVRDARDQIGMPIIGYGTKLGKQVKDEIIDLGQTPITNEIDLLKMFK